ncbi:ATP-binding protein [Pseudoalteromonas sp. T1lg10]|uniref:ATP-binding protein n=1 Tax=Pseudoalteromonas sp. T1lg10 TaxID=2077093 RepID=UPI000CF65F0C|nr:ATP-binding protein [Pseudoalteromonas sp. T1lg10]
MTKTIEQYRELVFGRVPLNIFRPNILLVVFVLGSCLGFASNANATLTLKADRQHHVNATSFNVEDGLSANSLQDMEFDQFSRLWIATQDGVNMLDANQVIAFGPTHVERGLKGSYIHELLFDIKSGLWVLSNHGIERLDTVDFSAVDVSPQLPPAQTLRSLIQWDNQHIAVLADNQLVLIDTTRFSVVKAPDSLGPVNNQREINGRLLIQTENQFSWVEPETFALTPAYPVPDKRRVISYTLDSNNLLWVVSLGGNIYRCDKLQCESVKLVTKEGEVASAGRVVEDNGKLFIVSSEGLFVVNAQLNNVSLLTTDNQKNLFTKRLHYHRLLIGDNGDLLIGSMDGLYLLPSSYEAISSYADFETRFGEEPLSAAVTQEDEQQRLVLAGSSTLLYFKEERGELTLLERRNYPEGFEPVHFIHTANRVFLNSYRSGSLYHSNGQWLGLGSLMPELEGEKTPLSDVYELASGDLVLLYLDELVFMRKRAEQYFIQWRTPLAAELAYSVSVKDDTLFVATFNDGLLIANWDDEQAPEGWQTIASEKMLTGIEQIDNALVLLTLGQGLSRIEPTKDGFQEVEIEDNHLLINKVTLCMAPYMQEGWIVSTNNGVAIFDNSLSLQDYLIMDDGLSHRESFQFACTKINNSTVNVGFNGVTVFHDKLALRPGPHLSWVSSKVDGKPFTIYGEEQQFTAPDMLAFKTALSFMSLNDNTVIEYSLNTQEGEWTRQEETLVTLPSLSSGTYQLFVRARLENGMLSNTLKFQFKVKPPVWLQPPAIIIYTLIFTAFVIWVYSLVMRSKLERLKYLEKQKALQDAYTKELQYQIKQTTEELEQKQRLRIKEQQDKARFITGASHDIKNLVSLLKLNVFRGSPTGASATHSSAHLGSVVDSLDQLTENIAQLSKLDAGIIEPVKAQVALDPILKSVENMFSPLCKSRNLSFKVSAPKGQFIQTDGHLLLRLINNLVDNAIKNTPENGEVGIVAECSGDSCHILVKDNGPGLPEGICLDNIAPFSRGTHSYTGSGLGLSVVSKIAELLNIPLSYSNANPHGAIFEIVLKTAKPADISDQTQQSAPIKLALVEDDPQQLNWLANTLRAMNYEVHCFTCADELLATDGTQFWAIISDVDLAQPKDGIDYLEEYRQKLAEHGVLVYVSGNLQAKARLSKNSGVFFMKKPIKCKKLEQLLIRGLKQ